MRSSRPWRACLMPDLAVIASAWVAAFFDRKTAPVGLAVPEAVFPPSLPFTLLLRFFWPGAAEWVWHRAQSQCIT